MLCTSIYSVFFHRSLNVGHLQLTFHTSALTADIGRVARTVVTFLTRCDMLLFQPQKSCENVQTLLTVGPSNVAFRKQNGGLVNREGNTCQQIESNAGKLSKWLVDFQHNNKNKMSLIFIYIYTKMLFFISFHFQ